MIFVDEAEIEVKGGDGGNGIVALRREKFVPHGGPWGGNGGHGGDVILLTDSDLTTLADVQHRRHYAAERGGHGGPNKRQGKHGEDEIIRVPTGTLVYDAETGELLADLVEDGQTEIAAHGGIGGRGNASFATSTFQTPRFAEKGEPGETRRLRLELKLLADVGIIGFPNVGKSTLISRISHAKPKIADYPFTTLVPNLGVVRVDMNRSFVAADIPGIIEGSHESAGLGDKFLRHVERTRLLIHILDVSDTLEKDPVEKFDKLNHEIRLFRERLLELPQSVALNKIDLPGAKDAAERVGETLANRGFAVYPISAMTGEGIDKLMYHVADRLENLAPPKVHDEGQIVRFVVPGAGRSWRAEKVGEGRFVVSGRPVERVVSMTDLDNDYAVRRMHRRLEKMGVLKELKKLGAKSGDGVRIGKWEFDYSDDSE